MDIRVISQEGLDLTGVEPFAKAVSDRFPNKQTQHFYSGGMEIKGEGPPEYLEPELKAVGFLCTSESSDRVVQGRIDGFSFSKLRPYVDWPSLRDEARDLWEIYRATVEPRKAVRLALRYINRLEIPLPITDFREYVLTSPEIAPDLPQALSEFFFKIAIPGPDINAMAIINSTIARPEYEGRVLPYIFDIDVFKTGEWQTNSAEIWEHFEDLRVYKNQLFFGSMTEKAKELFR